MAENKRRRQQAYNEVTEAMKETKGSAKAKRQWRTQQGAAVLGKVVLQCGLTNVMARAAQRVEEATEIMEKWEAQQAELEQLQKDVERDEWRKRELIQIQEAKIAELQRLQEEHDKRAVEFTSFEGHKHEKDRCGMC